MHLELQQHSCESRMLVDSGCNEACDHCIDFYFIRSLNSSCTNAKGVKPSALSVLVE